MIILFSQNFPNPTRFEFNSLQRALYTIFAVFTRS